MLFGLFFAFWRFSQIFTLIPAVGMLSWFIHLYVTANALTPDAILVLFIVVVLAVVWAIGTLFTYHRSKNNARFVALIDLAFVGAFIGGIYTLRGISGDNCTGLSNPQSYTATFTLLGSASFGGYGIPLSKTCAMLKASWALSIMNCLFFFFTSMLAFMHGGHKEEVVVVKRESHSGRHHRSRRGSHGSGRSRRSGEGSRAYV
ncbi:hypothetical protein O988_08929 [Pseudogymnoascus sp. VKM F-3808]|nr:hypothetical protein O988_08929 [Pseudogymnoascus sp. VKM F-3808]KFX88723.1 hypothetical protein V490_07438 [Pseudogymnoascus sp. VKM F-3557]